MCAAVKFLHFCCLCSQRIVLIVVNYPPSLILIDALYYQLISASDTVNDTAPCIVVVKS